MICRLEDVTVSVVDKKKVKFGTNTHRLYGLLELVYIDIWGPTKMHHLETIGTLSQL